MIRKSISLLVLALAAAAVAAPIAHSDSAPKVDPLAVSYLTGQGLTPSQVASWTTGVCSKQTKPASCFAMFNRVAPTIRNTPSNGFQWGDAGIGAGFTLGIVLLIGGTAAALLISRQSRRREAAHA